MNYNKHILIFFALILTLNSFAASRKDMEKRFEGRVYFNKDLGTMPYRLLRPANLIKGKKYPLILFLHGAGERGNDNRKQLHVGLHIFATKDHMSRYPCFIVAPQCPEKQKWVDIDWKEKKHTMPQNPSRSMLLAMKLTQYLLQKLPVDINKIYITGYSMGGYGVWDAIQRFPNFFAAAVPACGGGDPDNVNNMVNIPIWAFHGARDKIVPVSRTREIINAIQKLGGKPIYTEYPDVNHYSWAIAYGDLNLFDWMFKQELKK